jgi:hypothetical protein
MDHINLSFVIWRFVRGLVRGLALAGLDFGMAGSAVEEK